MPLNYEALLSWPFEEIEQTYTERDSILYALGVGLGSDPVDPDQLRFVYEEGLQALPTMAVVLGNPGFYFSDPASGVDWKRVVHGEQGLVLHRPLPSGGTVRSLNRIDSIVDKGKDRGALVYATRETRDASSGELICTTTATVFCRADGGFGGPGGPARPVHPVPERDADHVISTPTLPQAALIYRLSGDRNPLHADPSVARDAGFPRPILHGLCTYAIAGHAVLGVLAGFQPERLRRLDVRFSAPVLPGDTITTTIWQEGPGRAAFRCHVAEREATVIDNGYCEVAA
jgi:acyl dehydratase